MLYKVTYTFCSKFIKGCGDCLTCHALSYVKNTPIMIIDADTESEAVHKYAKICEKEIDKYCRINCKSDGFLIIVE